MVPKSRPTSQCASPHAFSSRTVSSGRASVVKSRSAERRPRKASRTGPADQRQLETGLGEDAAEVDQQRHHRLQRGDRAASRASSTARSRAVVGSVGAVGAERIGQHGVQACHVSCREPGRAAGYSEPMVKPAREPRRRLPTVQETSSGGLVVDFSTGVPRAAVICRLNRAGRAGVVPAQGAPRGRGDPRGGRGARDRGGDRDPRRGRRGPRQHRLLVLRRRPPHPQGRPPVPAQGRPAAR